jgi:CubicO group peptidase (beta-lactamase class C family)
LDDKLSQYVTGPAYWDNITIKPLLMMQSGIEDYLQQDASVGQAYFLTPTATFDPLPHIRSYAPLFEPGTQSSYSNSNYILLGMILEWVDATYGTGRDIRTIIMEDCLAPLGLTETEWPTGNYMTAPYSRGWAPNLALPTIQAMLGPLAFLAGLLGYPTTAEVEWTAVSTTWAGSAGALDGTVADAIKFGQALASGALLSPAMKQLRDETFVTYVKYTPANPWEGPGWMGFGLGVIQWGSWLGWIGNLGGYKCTLFANPTNGAVVTVLMNHMAAQDVTLFYRIAYLLYPETTLIQPSKVRPSGGIPSSATVGAPSVYVYHTPGDQAGKTDVPLKVPFYI